MDIQNYCEILHISTHRPRLLFRIDDAKVMADGVVVEDATRPSRRCMPPALKRELDSLESRVRKAVMEYAVAFHSQENGAAGRRYELRGVYVVPRGVVATLLERLGRLHDELRQTIRYWLQDDRLHTAIRAHVGAAVYEEIRTRIPDKDKLLSAARIDVVSLPIQANAELMRDAGVDSLLAAARSRTQEMLTSVADAVLNEPRQELAAAIAHFEELRSKGTLQSGSFNPLRAAVARLRNFDFVADSQLQDKLYDLERALNSTNAAVDLSPVVTSLQSIRDEVSSTISASQWRPRAARRIAASL